MTGKAAMSDAPPSNHPFASMDSVIEAMYRSVSGPEPGLDTETLQRIFLPQARMIRTGLGDDGKVWRTEMSVDDYQENTRELLPFAYVLSEYEAKDNPDSDELLLSGVNSIQCVFDGDQWWVAQLLWNHHV
jgi:hypothetical protein